MVKDRILVGCFGAPHGVKGEVRLKSFTNDPSAIAAYKPLLDASGARRFTIKALRHLKDDLFVARVAGVDDRNSAASLTNIELFVPRDMLPEAADEEFYLADLIGLTAMSEAGDAIGRVVNVLNFGGGDILEIAPVEGGETLLLPFTKDVVPQIDVAAGRITVALPIEIDGEAHNAVDK
ncbi:ribosome maturation factor RimM [Methylocapsa polymorpha]|uniref:Ribosome maturation factor RimM n=1 Tax=Methylocapsa polymorpha TaxID=3080828 RepID=A0ABZ0HW21_9HYPH|nr:ribosome maturation factor RimM [Methylocapsa sp. RX1]